MRLTTNRANGFELMLYSAKRMTQRLWASWSRVLQVHKPKQSKANNVAIIIDVDHKNSSDVDQFLSIEAKLKWATTALHGIRDAGLHGGSFTCPSWLEYFTQ